MKVNDIYAPYEIGTPRGGELPDIWEAAKKAGKLLGRLMKKTVADTCAESRAFLLTNANT